MCTHRKAQNSLLVCSHTNKKRSEGFYSSILLQMGRPGLPGFIYKSIDNSWECNLTFQNMGHAHIYKNVTETKQALKAVIHKEWSRSDVRSRWSTHIIYRRINQSLYIAAKFLTKITAQGDNMDLMMRNASKITPLK